MANHELSKCYPIDLEEEEEEDSCGSEDEYSSDDSECDQSYATDEEETVASFSKLSVKKKSETCMVDDMDLDSETDAGGKEIVVPERNEIDEKSFDEVQKSIGAGQLEKLKVEQCKVYLRKNGLRLTGNKDTLIQRIKEHLDILNGGGEKKYPPSSFVLNCKGDACTGDVVMFEQNVYETFNLASRSASGPPCGTRTVAGRVVKESYGASKQQHTFTIEVLWSKGEKPLPPLHQLLIKGRNLYRLKTLRQRWEDEGERQQVLMEKHLRGSLARSDREVRFQEKEKKKRLKAKRISRKESNRKQSQTNSTLAPKSSLPPQQSGLSVSSGTPEYQTQRLGAYAGSNIPAVPHQRFGLHGNSDKQDRQINQVFENVVVTDRDKKCIETRDVRHRINDLLAARGPRFYLNGNGAPVNTFSSINNGIKEFPSSQRPSLTTMNKFHPVRKDSMLQHLCRHYAKGRCHFGDNCKFSHGAREEYGQRREESLKNLHITTSAGHRMVKIYHELANSDQGVTHEDGMAVEAGVSGIVVSNHGARRIDYSPATISVVHAVGGKVPVLFDGGLRRGTDVFKALALGAKAVLVGRPIIYGLAAMEEHEVKRVLEMPRDELELTIALSGCPSQNRRGVCSTLIGEMASEPVNVNEFKNWLSKLQPRILVDVTKIDMSTTVLGYRISAPIMLAPTAMHQFAHPEGEVATARGAAASNTIMVLSYGSTCTIEEVASSCNAVRFFQLYVYKRRDITAQLVQRAEKSGFKALVLTVDVPRLGRREADIKNKMVAPQLRNLEGLISTTLDSGDGSRLTTYIKETMDASFCWEDIGWLRSITSLPILIKGVLTDEDARMAVEAGIEGIIVSNHGARQLDYTPATISVLEEVVHAVGGKVPVLFDGGVRRGTDVFKALGLGAKAVLVGRPIIYGLAAMGEYGVRCVLEMLKDELELTMALSGCLSVQHITRGHVRTEREKLHSML
ncbi:hypothetical protein FNV43_RR08091 [Rhamnella rubrinervis]|uniref:(S)-2-hydroxy-acid oxidase n=1 Tax=Rhamnella rubrinervis TaxID=2594499 RepID=A0A8K0HHT8_9ROSA|nr:hypothetical protein FNV43_RR08091 [Rhamnella rubrinervis]